MNFVPILYTISAIVVVYLVYYFFFRNKNEKKLVNMHDARAQQVISAGTLPAGTDANYTYSIWLYINDWNYRFGQTKVVFGRVDKNNDPSPSIKLSPSMNNLEITLATYPTTGSESEAILHNCNVNDLPIQKWVNIILSVNGRSLDVYMDGKLVKTCLLPGVPKINPNANIYITPDGGFSGYVSNFKYLAYPVNPTQAYNIYKSGYGGGGIASLFNKYRIKFAFVEDNKEVNSFEI